MNEVLGSCRIDLVGAQDGLRRRGKELQMIRVTRIGVEPLHNLSMPALRPGVGDRYRVRGIKRREEEADRRLHQSSSAITVWTPPAK